MIVFKEIKPLRAFLAEKRKTGQEIKDFLLTQNEN